MALAVTSKPASSFIGSHPGANGISLPTTASLLLTPVLFRNHGQDELFGARDFLLVPLGDLRADGLGGAFDGFGGNIQTREQFHRLASRSERHLTAHHSFHASYARRGLQVSDT